MRAKMDDFAWLVVIAIVILVILSIFSGWVVFPGQTQDIILGEFEIGQTGYTSELSSKTISLGNMIIGDDQSERLKKIPQIEVQSSVIGSSQEEYKLSVPEYMLDMNRGVMIGFTVADSTYSGKLIIKWNGLEVYNSRPSGRVQFRIDKDFVVGSNSIQVIAESPGWMFWATNYYMLENFDIDYIYGPSKAVPFILTKQELEKFSTGEVGFYVTQSGILNIKVNGKTVYSEVPIGAEIAEFDMYNAPLQQGNNILTFEAPSKKADIRGVILTINVLGNEVVHSRKFTIEEGQMDLFDQGWSGMIDLDIESFLKPGQLEIRINGNQVNAPQLGSGVNRIYFQKSDVQEGDNWIEISGTGSFDIGSAKVYLALEA